MRILLDQGTPVPLRAFLSEHKVATAYEQGWSNLENGDLLQVAESAFDLLITTDQNIRYQQNLKGRKLSILVLPTTNWPEIQRHVKTAQKAVSDMQPAEYRDLVWGD